MVAGLPTAISLSSTDDTLSDEFAAKLHCAKSFRVYKNSDFTGVQLGGAVKNVIAIGAGLADGLGFGANARTARAGFVEAYPFEREAGADPETFMGVAGLGDLVLTRRQNRYCRCAALKRHWVEQKWRMLLSKKSDKWLEDIATLKKCTFYLKK